MASNASIPQSIHSPNQNPGSHSAPNQNVNFTPSPLQIPHRRCITEPIVCLNFLNHHFSAILDTGSPVSILGHPASNVLRSFGVQVNPATLSLSSASGEAFSINESMEFSLAWHSTTPIRMKFYILPNMTPSIILGRDFIRKTGMVIYLSLGGWTFVSQPNIFHRFQECPHPHHRHGDGCSTRSQTSVGNQENK